jgi:hypothetical protein
MNHLLEPHRVRQLAGLAVAAVYLYLLLLFTALFGASFTPAAFLVLFGGLAVGYVALERTRWFHQLW